MPRRRIVLKQETAVYHVMNRLVRREFWLDERAKEVFVRILRKQAAFCGVEVLTYCIMGNHFHLLLRVPPSALDAHRRGDALIDDATLLERYRAFYGKRRPIDFYSADELEQLFQRGGTVAESARQRVLARMGDLSVFMQELKHRFMIWFNRIYDNEGTIWSAKFKSVLFENTVEIRSTVAAYIDLNPVRAGITGDPGAYPWSGFGAAVGGADVARFGLRRTFSSAACTEETWESTFSLYRKMLFSIGLGSRRREGGGKTGTVDLTKAEAVLTEGKPGADSRIAEGGWGFGRFLCSAKAIGCFEFLKSLRASDEAASGRKRCDQPRVVPDTETAELFALGRIR